MKIKNKYFIEINNLSPIVKECLENKNIILKPLMFVASSFPQQKMLFIHQEKIINSLIITHHPNVINDVKEIRTTIGIKEIICNKIKFINAKKYSEFNKQFWKIFSKYDKHLSLSDWEAPLYQYVITGKLAMPNIDPAIVSLFSIEKFQLDSCLKENKNAFEDFKELLTTPLIIFQQRIINEYELIDYIKNNISEIKEMTKELPKKIIKRQDISITKFCIGLWIYSNWDKGSNWLKKEVDDKYKKNSKYFGEYRHLDKTEFAGFKSDSLNYLQNFYPL